MRILLVNDFGWPKGGAELQVLALRDGLRRRGHDAVMFASRAEHGPDWAMQADETCFGTGSRLQNLTQVANPSAYLELRRVLAAFRPDVVHVRMFLYQLSPLILPLLRRVPSLYQAVVYKDVCPKGSKLLPDGSACTDPYGPACLRHRCVSLPYWVAAMAQLGLLERWRGAFDRTIALSGPMRDVLQAGGMGTLDVVHNGVAERPARPPLPTRPVIGYAGRLSVEKGVDTLLRAFAAVLPGVPDALLLVIGGGPEQAALERLARELGIAGAVGFLGQLSRDEMEATLDAAWVQAVPSLWHEPFGNVTTEAMMRGTAVAASDVGGQREIVRHGSTGFLLPPGDADALAGVLGRLLGDRTEAERLGAEGRRVAIEAFSQERAVDRFIGIYEELAAPTRRR